MNRKTTLSALTLAALAGGFALSGCVPPPAAPNAPAPQIPAPNLESSPEESGSYVEAWSSREDVMISVIGGNVSTSTHTSPHRVMLPDGFVVVTASSSPSVEEWANGTPDNAEVGCRIVRNGKVVDENTATGQFAGVNCQKSY